MRGSIAAFLVTWAIVFGQLVLGHDPALGQQHKAQTPTKSKARTHTASEDSTSSATSPAPVTTAQS